MAEPTPEEVFAGDPVNVYITTADTNAVASCLRAIRQGLKLLRRTTDRIPLSEAEAFLTLYIEGTRPTFLGNADNAEHAREVAEAMVETSHRKLGVGIGLTEDAIQELTDAHAQPSGGYDESPQAPEGPMAPLLPPLLIHSDDDAESSPSLAACKAAIALMAMHEGNGTRALIWARVLAQTTGDGDWDDAARLILASLPLKDPSA